ncbi:hypothetical protein SDRG_11400 [Saprolegnia diclina VS20]|uniref:Uncharacterized protein n=1 Tax=Saprolegnia diclina (strain VS20) TaxID=1156394 RepID=T0Q8H8_SAPDV|nr:hypothetical protein SDRG_11400 [Saprolegnia diclina VS20]EQC30921.1 hypothetical protein SDRG_11400 [Saprolegnia diclina VS20]|eukprot:XP_008615659.1 hypothetical protein SDRG_11400 [Saprolegnia diclina VS20]
MAKVSDIRAAGRTYGVHRTRLAFIASVVSFLNLSSPLAAYVSENFPWTERPALETFASYEAFSNQTRALNQALYSAATLPTGETYVVDTKYDAQVTRALRRMGQPSMSEAECFQDHLLGLPGLIYYSNSHVDLVCATLRAPNVSSVTDWAIRGSCFRAQLCSFGVGHSCLWLVPGDAIFNRSTANDSSVTIYFVYTESRDASWVWFKFVYRIGATLLVWHRFWRLYYRHVVALETRLETSGHRQKMPDGAWSYELIVGDPTAMILLDPWVASLYFLDIWLSAGSLAIAIMQVQQNEKIWLMLVSMAYLARTVWFAYWYLCIVSFGLKRYRKEHVFSDVDPTLVAIVVSIYGPVLTYLNGNVALLARLYQWIFNCVVPSRDQGQRIEAGVGASVYTVLIGSLPLLHGLVMPHLRPAPAQGSRRRRTTIVEGPAYSSFHYNNTKNRVVLQLLQMLRRFPTARSIGGQVHAAAEKLPRLKRCPTISLRGTDCFVLCYCNGRLDETLRLSLLSTLQLQPSVVIEAPTPSDFTVDVLQPLDHSVFVKRQEASGPQIPLLVLQRASTPSVWCL